MTAVLVVSVQLLSACRAQFALPLPLRSRRKSSFESQTFPNLARPLGSGSSCHKGCLGPRDHPTPPAIFLVSQAHLGQTSLAKMKNSPRDLGGGGNHGNCLLNGIIVTLSESSLFLQLSDTPKFSEFLSMVLLYLGAKSFCSRNPTPIE